MNAIESMDMFLCALGCRKRHTDYILDGFSSDMYLRFDAAEDRDNQNLTGTVDIHVVEPGDTPTQGIRVLTDCRRHQVMRFMYALGIARFSEQTRKLLDESNSIIRTQPLRNEVSS